MSNGSIIKIHPSSEGMIGAGKLEVFATVFFGNDDAVENNLKHGRGLGGIFVGLIVGIYRRVVQCCFGPLL